jgi:beta-glucosidase
MVWAQAIRAAAKPGTQVGLADNATIFVPVIETQDHIAATMKAMREENAMFLTAIMEGAISTAISPRRARMRPR